jgi:hypothetical protein
VPPAENAGGTGGTNSPTGEKHPRAAPVSGLCHLIRSRQAPDGEGAYLRSLQPDQAARVMGSRERAQQVLDGASVDSVVNAGRDPLYRLRRLGDPGTRHALVKPAESPAMATPYEIAKAGGDGSKYLKQLPKLGRKQLDKSVESLTQRALEHEAKIASPADFVADWPQRSPEYRTGLLAKWRTEVDNFRMQADIIKGYLNEHGL